MSKQNLVNYKKEHGAILHSPVISQFGESGYIVGVLIGQNHSTLQTSTEARLVLGFTIQE